MQDTYVKPTARAVSELLSTIYGDDFTVSVAEPPQTDRAYVATYVNADDDVVAVGVCDPEFVAFSGASFSMMPADAARELAASGDISGSVLGNFHEIMNICSRLMLSDDSAHLKLRDTLRPDEAQVALASFADADKHAFAVTIPGYGDGKLAFFLPI